MAEEHPSLSIDTDWKKQAQEEKRRLAEEAQRKSAAAAAATAPAMPAPLAGGPPGAIPPGGPPAPAARGAGRGRRELPPVGFNTLVQSILTQILFYLGDLSPQGGEPMLNLDMAKHQIDTLGMLE